MDSYPRISRIPAGTRVPEYPLAALVPTISQLLCAIAPSFLGGGGCASFLGTQLSGKAGFNYNPNDFDWNSPLMNMLFELNTCILNDLKNLLFLISKYTNF